MYVIEKITALSWFFSVLPYLRKNRWPDGLKFYYIDATKPGLWLARTTGLFLKVTVERFDFTLFDARDANGDMLWWKVVFEDLSRLQKHMTGLPEFRKVMEEHEGNGKLRIYLSRRAIYFDSSPFPVMRFLLIFRLASQRAALEGSGEARIFLFSSDSQRPWLSPLAQWAKEMGIQIMPIKRFEISLKKALTQSVTLKNFAKQILFEVSKLKYRLRGGHSVKPLTIDPVDKIAVEYYGSLNLDSPMLASDLFFCQQSQSLYKNILVYFQHPALPSSDGLLDEIHKHGMSAVAVNSRATKTPQIEIFQSSQKKERLASAADSPISRDLAAQGQAYARQRNFWIDFFRRYNVKIHVSWYKTETVFFPLADALGTTGGISVIYQRSFESLSSPWSVTAADVVFGFSTLGAHLDHDTDSVVPYYVVTGYLGDFRFSLVKTKAQEIRQRLQSNGAQRILAFFDENSVKDSRWNIGHETTRQNYEFLLKKVIDTPWLGLLLKPKIFSDLYHRLGPVADLIARAEATGRCHIFKEKGIIVPTPPALAALAADVSIHGHFFAATAGAESALTGTPTLMLDREGFSASCLHRLGEGNVIFKNWDDLWQACLKHWNKEGKGRFADWSPMIDEIDPFRDGRAAERMAVYLKWMMEGLQAGLSRQTVLADAAERYTKMWGKDKVLSVNCGKYQSQYA